ncbi:MAG: hypothetical protein ACI4HZ_00605 [Ruminococcus sp.]
MDKERFIRNSLLPLCKEINGDIDDLQYINENGEEFVDIKYLNINSSPYTLHQQICISANSIKAIAIAVINEI